MMGTVTPSASQISAVTPKNATNGAPTTRAGSQTSVERELSPSRGELSPMIHSTMPMNSAASTNRNQNHSRFQIGMSHRT